MCRRHCGFRVGGGVSRQNRDAPGETHSIQQPNNTLLGDRIAAYKSVGWRETGIISLCARSGRRRWWRWSLVGWLVWLQLRPTRRIHLTRIGAEGWRPFGCSSTRRRWWMSLLCGRAVGAGSVHTFLYLSALSRPWRRIRVVHRFSKYSYSTPHTRASSEPGKERRQARKSVGQEFGRWEQICTQEHATQQLRLPRKLVRISDSLVHTGYRAREFLIEGNNTGCCCTILHAAALPTATTRDAAARPCRPRARANRRPCLLVPKGEHHSTYTCFPDPAVYLASHPMDSDVVHR